MIHKVKKVKNRKNYVLSYILYEINKESLTVKSLI